jgi:hypothetical protein
MHPILTAGLFAGLAALAPDPHSKFQQQAIAAISGEWGPQPEWKLDLLFRALIRNPKPEPEPCLISLYHPREAGGGWQTWAHTRTGTCVRPGVASCTSANWRRWAGAWLWIEDYGVCHVEDSFPESTHPRWFDLASPVTATTLSYDAWVNSTERAQYAREYGLKRASFIVLKAPQ